jgi:ankyrin repeat protein
MDTVDEKVILALKANDKQNLIDYLNRGIDIWYVQADSHWTLLNYAVEHNNFDFIERLLSLGLDVNYMGPGLGGWPAVHHATELSQDDYNQNDLIEPNTQMLELILSYNPDLTLKDSSGRIPTDYAYHDKLKKLLLNNAKGI